MVDPNEITRHLERHVGPVHTVFLEIVSDDMPIDVLHIKSSLFRRYEVLITSGMSAMPMAVPVDSREARRAEMLVVLPKGWPIHLEAFLQEVHYWPVRLIKDLARFPNDANIWLGYGHTVGNGSSDTGALLYAPSVAFCAAVILPPMTLGENAWKMKSKAGEDVYFWAAVPLYADELAYKQAHGIDALLDCFDHHKVTERIDIGRPSAVGDAFAKATASGAGAASK
jgi:hypothetical protein